MWGHVEPQVVVEVVIFVSKGLESSVPCLPQPSTVSNREEVTTSCSYDPFRSTMMGPLDC